MYAGLLQPKNKWKTQNCWICTHSLLVFNRPHWHLNICLVSHVWHLFWLLINMFDEQYPSPSVYDWYIVFAVFMVSYVITDFLTLHRGTFWVLFSFSEYILCIGYMFLTLLTHKNIFVSKIMYPNSLHNAHNKWHRLHDYMPDILTVFNNAAPYKILY